MTTRSPLARTTGSAIDATRSTESAALSVLMMVGTQALAFEGEYTTGGRGHVTAVDADGQEMELRTNGAPGLAELLAENLD
jgi:hypothetical protein